MSPLQEVFNSPYATKSFRQYAEKINFGSAAPRGSYDVDKSGCESIQMLSKAAKEEGVWLVGGQSGCAAILLAVQRG